MKIKRITVIAMLCVVCVLFASCGGGGSGGFKLELDKIKNSDEVFCYEGLNWKDTAEDTKTALGLDLGEAQKFNAENDGVVLFERSFYYPDTEIKLMKKKGKCEFEFRNDELTAILIHFEGTKKELEPFANSIVDELVKLYSDKYELTEQALDSGATKKIYDWTLPLPDGKNISHLQLYTLEKSENSIPQYTVDIGILCPNPKPQPK